MRSFLFAVKILFFFAVLLVAVLGTILVLFVHLAADEVIEELNRLRAFEGVAVARGVEGRLAAGSHLTDADMADFVAHEGRNRRLAMHLRPGEELPQRRIWGPARRHAHWIEIEGRRIQSLGPRYFESSVPVFDPDDRETQVAWLVVQGAGHLDAIHHGFFIGLVYIGLVALVASGLLAALLTVPIRKMGRSMDRIADGEFDHRVTVRGRDEMAAMARSFNTMADRISAMVTGQKELMAGVSHELRSPLARMKLSVELLRDDRGGFHRLDDLEGEIDAIDRLVGELLLLSRFDLGAVPRTPESLDLEALARAAWERLHDREGLTLELDLAADATHVGGDRALVERIFGNLFANATRYAGSGRVTVRSRRLEEWLELTVEDEGPGVPVEHRGRLFEPFYRVDPSRPHGRGVGLGLMIVRRAIEAHGGWVRAGEATGGGLAVVFTLPGG